MVQRFSLGLWPKLNAPSSANGGTFLHKLGRRRPLIGAGRPLFTG